MQNLYIFSNRDRRDLGVSQIFMRLQHFSQNLFHVSCKIHKKYVLTHKNVKQKRITKYIHHSFDHNVQTFGQPLNFQNSGAADMVFHEFGNVTATHVITTCKTYGQYIFISSARNS